MPYTSEAILLLVLLFLSGFFSASEIALFSVTRLKVRRLMEQNVPGAAMIQRLKENPQRALTTILIGNNIMNVAAAAIATKLALQVFNNNAVAIATGVMTLLLLVFGEIVPKYFAARFNTRMALISAPIIWGLSVAMLPLVKFFQYLLAGFDKLLGVKKAKQPTLTEEELKSIVQMGREEGAIKETERSMIQRIFDFDNIPISEVMTRKADMRMVSAKSKVRDVLSSKEQKQYSRLPVYLKSRDKVVGVLYVKDALGLTSTKGMNGTLVEKIMRKPLFVPETKKLDSLLRQFQRTKEHMAIVVDEHGSIVGLITIEDVLEEIVGEIMDETDRVDPVLKKVNENTWKVKGKADLEELSAKLRLNAKDVEADTLNGLLQELTGRIPKEGETVKFRKFSITVDKMDDHRVESVTIVKG